MKRVLTLYLAVMMLIGLVIPLAGFVTSAGPSSESAELTGFHDVEIEADPPIRPTGIYRPATDENVDITVTTGSTGIDEARLNVSAIRWGGQPVPGLDPSNPGVWSFDISEDGYEATSFLNNVKYFPPGTEVTWNVYLLNYSQPARYSSVNYTYEVRGAWRYNNSFEDAFERNLDMSISPDLPPNAYDPVTITLESEYDDVEIGQAILDLSYRGDESGDGSLPFRNVDPIKGIEEVTIPGFAANTEVDFSIRAWDDPDDASREIESDVYNYTVAAGNIFDEGSFEDNIEITTDPEGVADRETETEVGFGEPVNITIRSRDPQLPIQNAAIEFELDARGMEPQEGVDEFNEISSTEWYYEIDGQAPGVEVKFRIRAFDIMSVDWEDGIVSLDYTYTVSEDPPDAPEEMTYFYVTVFDGEKNEYVSGAHVTIQNETWIWEGHTNVQGAAWPTVGDTLAPREIYYGTYEVTVEYEGLTQNKTFELEPGDDQVDFVFNPAEDPERIIFASPVEMPPYYLIGLCVSSGLAGMIGYLFYNYRRDKDERKGLAAGD